MVYLAANYCIIYMAYRRFLLLVMLLSGSFFGASAQNIDSVVQYTYIKNALTERSRFFDSGRYAYYLPIRLHQDDLMYFLYESRDYVGSVFVRDSSLKGGIWKHDNESLFAPLGSKIKMPFKAPFSGIYYFILTTRDARTMGKFGVQLFYFDSKKTICTSDSPFVYKLRYIAKHANTGFEFLKSKVGKDGMGRYFQPSVDLVNDGFNQIISEPTEAYLANYAPFKTLKQAKNKYNALAKEIAAALPEYSKTESHPKEGQEDTYEIEYILKGDLTRDINSLHFAGGFRSKVVLSLKPEGDEYIVAIQIQ